MNSSEILGQAWQHHQAGQFNRAEKLYQQVLSGEPENADALHMLGILAHQTGHSEAGAELVKRALRQSPEDARMHANLAMIFEAGGRLQQAIEHNRTAIALMPGHVGARLNLANQLRVSGDIEAAIASYRELLDLQPNDSAAWSNLGSALRASGHCSEAVAAFERALSLQPDSADIYSNLGNALQDEGHFAQAIQAFRKAVDLAPGFADAHANLGVALLQAGKVDASIQSLDDCLQRDAANRTALAVKTLALYQRGGDEVARQLSNLDTAVKTTIISSAKGFESVAMFNRALAEHVCNHPSIRYEPFSKTTRKGRQTGNLLDGARGPVARLEQIINQAIQEYLDQLPFEAGHPYGARRINKWDLNIWATVLDDQGHQAPHIHPGGWLSGVYYVALPAGMQAGAHAGCIEFGSAPDDLPLEKPVATRLLTPEEGALLVFPSFFYHRTLPFAGAEPRISIAFDMIPVS